MLLPLVIHMPTERVALRHRWPLWWQMLWNAPVSDEI